MVFLRVIGGILLLAGIAALGFDLWQYVQGAGQAGRASIWPPLASFGTASAPAR